MWEKEDRSQEMIFFFPAGNNDSRFAWCGDGQVERGNSVMLDRGTSGKDGSRVKRRHQPWRTEGRHLLF